MRPLAAPRLVSSPGLCLVGLQTTTTRTHVHTPALWRRFMPRRAEVGRRVGPDHVAAHVYPAGYRPDTPEAVFETWATVEVDAPAVVPEEMETLVVPAGAYAVFVHHGPASAFPATAAHIFGVWLPASGFTVDGRPHLERLGPGYRPDDPEAEEEVWIPVRPA